MHRLQLGRKNIMDIFYLQYARNPNLGRSKAFGFWLMHQRPASQTQAAVAGPVAPAARRLEHFTVSRNR
jgi:hypothetical protein